VIDSRKRIVGWISSAFLLLLLMLFPSAASATTLPAKITENTTLTTAGSPYTGTSTIEAGVTVQVEPGAKFSFATLAVKGTLLAEGTVEAPIAFESAPIKLEPGSGASVLDHVVVEHGSTGAGKGAIEVNGSSPRITNSTIAHNYSIGINIPHGGSPEIANNHVFDDGDCNINYAATTGESGEVNIHDNLVETGGFGIKVIVSGSTVTGKTLGANTIYKGGTAPALTYKGPDIPNDVTGNTLIENTQNVIILSGTVAHPETWNSGTAPVTIEGSVTVAAGQTLTITKGVVLKNGPIAVKGTLLAEGTVEAPIAFESAPIKLEPGSGASVLDHVVVEHGSTGAGKGAIEVNGSSPRITNSTIAHNYSIGINIPHGGSPEIANNHVFDDGDCNINYAATTGESGEVNIHDNLVETGGFGIKVIVSGSTVTGKTLGANTIYKGGTAPALTYKGPDIPNDVTGNTLIENTQNVIILSGTVAHPETWNSGTAPVTIEGSVTVAAGQTLTITKGVLLRTPNMMVKGTLKAEGTAEEPIVFTGTSETSKGEWGAIKLEPGSGASVLDHVEVKYGGLGTGAGMIEVKGSSPRITNSTIRMSYLYGINVTESGHPTVERNRFRSNSEGLSYTGTGNLSAPNNDWGCASGPKPAGCGDAVTSNVKWKPAVQLPELGGHCRGKESQCGEGADPVSLATGALAYSHRDLLLSNKSTVPLEFARSYSSASSTDAGLGVGWSQSGLATATELASGEVLIVRQDGRQDNFQKTESGYQAPSGVTDKLAKVEGTFQLTTLEGTVYRFDASGRIASITDNHGLKMTYAYNAEGRLATITDPSAQTLTFS
jgi:YD repeat-containing protein